MQMHRRPPNITLYLPALAAGLCLLCAGGPLLAEDDAATVAANVCLDGVGELYPQHRFTQAAEKYMCAADALAGTPGHEEKAARYRANSWFYRSWGTYTQKPVSGPLGQENLADAIRQVQQSLPLWQAARFPIGERLSQAWLLYLNGVQAGVAGQYAASHDDFSQARDMFVRIGEDAPPVRELTDMMLGLAEDQTVFAEVMKAMADPAGYENQGGYIDARLGDMKRRALPETKPYYDSLAAELRVGRQFLDAADRLDAWDYRDAGTALDSAKTLLKTAMSGADAVPGEAARATYKALLVGWSGVIEAESHHAAALKSLLVDGDTAKAGNELRQGVDAYRQAQASFETAGYPPGSIAGIGKSYARLNERAAAVTQAFGPTRAALLIGATFFGFFAVTIGALTALRLKYLPLKPSQILWAGLVVAIISAFGLRSAEIFQVLKMGAIPK